jgi:hypothetical protein
VTILAQVASSKANRLVLAACALAFFGKAFYPFSSPTEISSSAKLLRLGFEIGGYPHG